MVQKSFRVFLHAVVANKNKSSYPYIAEWQHLDHALQTQSTVLFEMAKIYMCIFIFSYFQYSKRPRSELGPRVREERKKNPTLRLERTPNCAVQSRLVPF